MGDLTDDHRDRKAVPYGGCSVPRSQDRCEARLVTGRRWDQGSAGHWLPAATCRHAMGEPTAPPVTQHLKPVAQSVSAAQGAPLPPLPGMQAVVGMVSMPAWWALQW